MKVSRAYQVREITIRDLTAAEFQAFLAWLLHTKKRVTL